MRLLPKLVHPGKHGNSTERGLVAYETLFRADVNLLSGADEMFQWLNHLLLL